MQALRSWFPYLSCWPQRPPAPMLITPRCLNPSGFPTVMCKESWTLGVGEVTYACREKKDHSPAATPGHSSCLPQRSTTPEKCGRHPHYGGPTWEDKDGSKVTGKQVAVSPAAAGNLPLQLVKANPTAARKDVQRGLPHPAAEHGRRHSAQRRTDMASLGKELEVAHQAELRLLHRPLTNEFPRSTPTPRRRSS
ncbi:MAG: hypothetical protein IPL05_16145 [Betaproteobacteria bacterium]|nr:hypothetical protein [Betaproteobacteria bacterium]